MALMNRRLNPDIETVFMMPAEPLHLRQLAPWSRKCLHWEDRLPASCQRRSNPGCAANTEQVPGSACSEACDLLRQDGGLRNEAPLC